MFVCQCGYYHACLISTGAGGRGGWGRRGEAMERDVRFGGNGTVCGLAKVANVAYRELCVLCEWVC